VAAVRNLTQVKVFSPTPAHRDAFAEKMGRELEISVIPTAGVQEALADADVVITATSARTPILDGAWLKPGTHITSIANGDKARTRQELDDTTMRRAELIFITSKETVCVNESDVFRAVRDKVITWDRVHEISSLLLGRVPGRTDNRQITLFKLQGTGIMDVAIGLRAYGKVKSSGLARML
jgi:ornithine cyclodeaminase/alanine dehydrogenase-like protein (mu-crystallin family)